MDALTREEMHEVDELLEDIYTGETTEEVAKERFKIKALDGANWAFRKLRAIEIKEAEIKALRDEEIKRIQEWAEQDLNKCKDSKQFFEFLLEEYYREQKVLDPKFKISTPYGKVSSRKSQPKWNYDDEKLVEWLQKNDPDLLRVKLEPNKTEIKKTFMINDIFAVTEDGEIVDGITIEEQPESVTIKVEV